MLELKYEPYNLLHERVKEFKFEDSDPDQLEKDMIELMLSNKGIGLAANQVGLDQSVFIMGSNEISGFCKPQIFINPFIIKYSDEQTLHTEGCLSFPGLFMKIKRPSSIEVAYQEKNGNIVEARIDGYMAKAFQHEFDHLNGICFTDKVSKIKLDMAVKKLIKNRR